MELIAQKREKFGKQVKKLRTDRQIPAVMFGKGLESTPVTIELNKFIKVYDTAGENTLVDLNIDGTTEKVLIKDVQFEPVTGAPIHAGFHKVNLKEKISAEVPVEIIGADKNELVKSGAGLVLTLLNEITVEALPSDLPSKFVVDVSNITEIGDAITVSQLEYDKTKVELPGYEPDDVIVKIDNAVMAEEPEEETVSEAEALAKVEATEELSEEEKKAREEAKAKEEGKDSKEKK
ncbi:MAG: hypothetical protein ACD_22C00230G0003 [uncultured bacterium]|nr:MAG: hypothetical protein ACD_22C00230G0003 [uncultured bacterium]